MVVMIVENVSPTLRGELTRWLIEPQAGIFVGHLSAMVRDRLWKLCCEKIKGGAAIQVWSTNNEQRFTIRTYGETRRLVKDFDGLQLIQIPLTKT